ncbi:MAG TPA: KamA family radical SAM protein [Acidobacteriota bacterium]|nr:KamA family radical SAM protein [Acidobacteriota bacterium]
MLNIANYNAEYVKSKVPEVFELAAADSIDDVRQRLSQYAHHMTFETFDDYDSLQQGSIIRVRDCARAFIFMLSRRSDDKAGFSIAGAVWDIAQGHSRPDLTPAFYAELLHLLLGIQGRGPGTPLVDLLLTPSRMTGREAAIDRSRQLDELSLEVQLRFARYSSGLTEDAIRRREARRTRMLNIFNIPLETWYDWNWQVQHILRDGDQIASLVTLSDEENRVITSARKSGLPFGITPYYLSLMDDEPNDGRDRAIRAQVIPSATYVEHMAHLGDDRKSCDFMRETDTSPVDLVTRRYPQICIFKPFNTCPQICVYCQRNWEIDDPMQVGALASDEDIERALQWIEAHPAIHEVLITGGDPLAMSDADIERILDGVARIPSIERIRIGSRVFVTMPMRITDALADLLARYRIPGKRQVAVVTHVQHPYELTPETAQAVEKLTRRGIKVYNQLVYTFFVSRRFEASLLRQQLALLGIDPYYTFNAKGKDETVAYRVPLARLLQEQKEEARLLPGLARTDEAVYNVPGMGKNYLRARQHRDLISILPNGARLYEFHAWEKNISTTRSTDVCEDVPILEYLQRLNAIGEDVSEYDTIWYYF